MATENKPISKLKIGNEVKHIYQSDLESNLEQFTRQHGSDRVYVNNPDGKIVHIPISQLSQAMDSGYTLFDDSANYTPKLKKPEAAKEPEQPTPGEEFYARNIAPNVNNQLVDIFTDATKPVNNSIQQAAQAVSNLPEVPRVPGQTDLEYAEKVTAISNKVLKAQQEAETQRMLAEALPTRQEELDGRLAEIDGELSSLGERRYGKLDANPAYGNPMLMGIDINAYQKSRLSDEDRDRIKQLQSERDALQLQKSFLNTIQKYESYDRKGDKSGISNFFRAIKVGGDLQSLASFGLTKMQDDLNFRRILEKVNNNETLSLEEKKAMQMYLNMQEVASLDRGASFSAGLGMQQTFEFMRDIALTAMTGGVGAGSMLAKQGVMAITKQFLKNSAKKIGEVAIKTPLTPSFYKGLTAAQVDNYEMGIDYDGEFTATPKRGNAAVAYRTFAETGVEFFTESLSGLLGSIGIAKRLANTVKGNGILSKALKTYDTVLDKTKQNPVGEKILQGLSTLGIGNIPEEMFEEIAAVPLRSLVLGENQMEQLLDPRFYQEVLISTAAIGGMTGATNILIGGSSAAIEKKKINDRIKESRTVLSDFAKNADSNIKSAYDKLANDLDNDNFYDEDGEFAPEVLVEDLKGLRDATDNNQDIMTQAEDFVKYTMFKKGQTEALRAMAEEELGPIEYGNSGSVMLFHDNTDGRTYHILGETEDVMILGTNDKTIAPDGKLVVPKNTVHGQISKPISLHNYVTDYFINKPEPTTVETLDDISEVQHFGGVATINDGVQVTINRGDKAMYGDVTVEVLDIYDSGDGTIEASVQDENGETHNISFNELSPIPKSDDLTTKDRYILPDGRRAVVQSAQGGNIILGVLDDNNQIVEEIPSTMDEVIGLSKVPAEEANVVEAVAAESGAIGTESGAIGTESGAIGTESGAIGTDELPLDKDRNVDYDTLLAQSPARFVEQMRADFGAEVADAQMGKMVINIDNKITELSQKMDKETSPNKVASMLREINTLQGQRDAISSALAPVEPTATIEATPAESAETTQEIAPDANNIANVATSAPVEEISAEDAETSAPVEEANEVEAIAAESGAIGTETGKTSTEIKENDTATLQNTVSEDKDTTTNNVEEKTETKPNDNQTETKPKPNKTILEKAQDTVESTKVDAAAQEANTEPTEAQKEAGNYKKGHTIIQGLNISIEQPKGSTRSGKDPNGKKWSVKMNNHYGYIRGTQGKDKDHIDVFIGDNPTSKKVYVVDQMGSDGLFDEHKVMIGFDSLEEAKAAYLSNYEEGWQGLGNITETSMNEFKEWIGDGTPKTRQFAEYAKGIPESYMKRAAQWQKKLGIGITVYNSIDDIKEKSVQEQLRVRIGVSGWISRDDNGGLKEIGIYLPYINSKTDVDKTAIHEIVAHYGLKGLLGEDKYNELCDNVWELMRPYEQDQYLRYPGVNNDTRKAADEYIAHLAESMDAETLSRSDKSIWEKIVEAVKNFFAPHKKTDVDLTDAISKADLSTLLRASYARLASESGKKTQSKKPSKFKLEDAVLKEKNSTRPALTGIYHDSGYKVASNTNVLVALKEDYPKSAEGKVFVKGKPIAQSNYPKWQILFNDKFEKSNIPVDFDKLIEKLSTIKKNEGKMPYYISLKANDGQVYYYHPDRLMIFAKAAKEIGGELMMQRFNQGLSSESVKLIITSPRGKAIIMPIIPMGKIGDSANIYDISFVDESTPVAQFVEKYETKENQTETKPKPNKTKEKPTTSKEVSSTPSKGKVQDQKIEDFGEKIGGARKDVARQRVRDAVNLTKTDLQKLADPDKILSRANIIKSLREGTMTKEDAITLMAINNTVRCADSTEKYIMMPKYRDMALAWANGQSPIFHITDKDIEDRFEQIGEHIKARMSDAQVEKHKQNIKKYYDILYGYYSDYIKTYRDLDYPNVERKLSGAVIWENPSTGSYCVFKKADARRGRSFRTREAAIAYMEREYPVVVAKAKESKTTTADNSQKIGHLRVVKDSTGWFRIKSSEIPGEIYFSKSFSTRKGAEEYLQENRDTLIAKEQRAIDALMGSNIGMAERQGPDYRNGKDVTSDEYLQAFGFRGVEFGNWVPQAERQMYLNKSYDAIMDICSILGISPKAFSLGGKLAIAFGARGHSKTMAHYESSKQVINLTRMKGVGSFAHEWFHAIDNYLAREQSGNTTEFVTEKHPTKRQELYEAFNEFVSKMNSLDYTRRSRRAGEYWGSVIERAARMFESYIYTELGAKDISSPLLVDSHSILSDDYLLDSDISSYPIPTADETRQIKPYLDKIFATIQEEVDTDGNHILFRVAENVGSFEDVLRNAKDKGYKNLSAYPDVTNQMLEDALTSGRIMVYSKDPIAGGTIVSPSVQYASELSGSDAQIYSKDISIDQVAWETPDQGTYTTNDDIRFRLIREQDAVSINTSEEINSYFNDELQKQIEGTLPKGHVYQIGMPSDILRSAGIPNLPIEMSSQRLVHKSNQKNHPFDLSEVIDLPKAIQSPLGVFRSATHIGSNVILTELKQGNKNFVVAIQTNKQKGRIQINDIRSIHPRTTSNIINWINEGLMDYADVSNLSSWIEDKIKSRDYLNSSTPAEVRKSLVSAAKVVKDFKNPNTDDIRFRFIGEQGAANLDRAEEASIRMDNLAVAREMETAGKDAKTIKMATGWERGADKKWRYEVDDNIDFDSPIDRLGVLNEELRSTDNEKDRIIRLLLRFPTRGRTDKEKEAVKQLNKKHQTLIHKADALRNSIREIEDEIRETTLQSLIGEENNLFKEYPQLAETTVSFIRNSNYGNYKGFYSPAEDYIWISPDNGQPASTLTHEIQHAIQHIEGFAKGGNTDTGNILRDRAKAWSWKKQLEETEKEHPELAGTIELQNILEEEYKDMSNMLPTEEIRNKGFNLYARGYDNEGYESAFEQWVKLGLIGNPNDYRTYKNLAGEVEARNVQKRAWMPLSARRETLAQETEDVSREDQIFIMDEFSAAENDIRFRIESLVERTYRKDGSFSFLGKNKIKSTDDVAFIFKQLEDSAIENAFMAFVKDGKPTILHVGMGDIASSIIDSSVVLPAYKDFGADKVYVVHNHPSGNLIASKADIDMLLATKAQLPDVPVEGIIINTLSGNYAIINEDKVKPILETQDTVELEVLSFSKNVFSPDYKTTIGDRTIYGPESIAAYLSAHRLGSGSKVGALLLNRRNVINGNLVTNSNEVSTENAKDLAFDIAEAANRCSATAVVLFGDFDYSDKAIRELERQIPIVSGKTVSMLDVVRLNGKHTQSLHDMTLPSRSTLSDGVRFRVEQTDQSTLRDNLRAAIAGYIIGTNTTGNLVTTDDMVNTIYDEVANADDSALKSSLIKCIEGYEKNKEVGKLKDSIITPEEILIEEVDDIVNLYSDKVMFRISNVNQRVFISNAEQAVRNINMGKASAEQWLKTIIKSGGLKAGEDRWIGLSDWLKMEPKDILTKDEVLQFINDNIIDIQEQHYTSDVDFSLAERKQIEFFNKEFTQLRQEAQNTGQWFSDAAEIAYTQMGQKYGDDFTVAFNINQGELYVSNFEAASSLTGIQAPIEREIEEHRLDYTTEGLDNNREIALIVPTIESWNRTDEIHFGDAGEGRAIAWARFGETTIQDPLSLKALAAEEARRKFIKEKKEKYGNDYLSHLTPEEIEEFKPLLRFSSTYKKALEKKVLVIDEIQSKRHQEGREKGYKSTFGLTKEKERLSVELDKKYEQRGKLVRERENEKENEMAQIYRIDDALMEVRNNRDYDRLMAERDAITTKQQNRTDEILALEREIKELEKELGELAMDFGFSLAVPDAPFEKNWHELTMKRMLRLAAENGYDKIAWTTGGQQAQRYNIGQKVDKIISFDYNDNNGSIEKQVLFHSKDGQRMRMVLNEEGVVISGAGFIIEGTPFTEVVGKDISQKVMNNEGENAEVFLGGNNYKAKELDINGLHIGGEGMKGFYDKMLPSFMNKYCKKWGVKVEELFLPKLGNNGLTMHSVDITPEMKASVLQGQLMFRVADNSVSDEVQSIINAAKANDTYMKAPNAINNTGAFNPQDADIQYRIPTTTAEDINKNGFQSYLSEKGYDQMKKDILKGAPILRMSQYTPESYISSTVDRLISDMPDGKLEAMQVAAAVRDAFDREGIFLDMSDNEIIYSLWKEVNPDTAVTVKETLEYSFRSSDVRFRIDQNVGPVTNDIKLSKGEIFTENWVDKMISVKMFQELIKRRGGVVSDELNPYITENLSLGRQQREDELFKDKIYRPMVEQVTEVEKLFVALGLASKEEAYKAVNDYLYARHAPERNKHVVIEEISNYLYKFITKDEAKFINYDNIQSAIRALATRIYNETFEGRPKTSDTAARGMLLTKGKTKEENEQLKEFRNKFFSIVASAQTMALKISTSKQGNNRSGMTDKEAKEIVQKLYRDDTKDALDRLSELVRASTHFTLDTWYKYNMISAKERDNYKSMYKYYIPLRNWEVTEDVDYENLTHQAFNHASEIISTNKRARGRTSRADNPLAYIASLAQSAIVLGNKNQVRLNMFRLVQKNSALLKDVATIPTVYYIKENSGEITAQIEKPEQELFDKGLVETKTNRDYRWHKTTAEYQAHLIPVIINGTRHVIEMRGNFGLKVASAVNNTNAVHLSYLDKVRPVTQWLSATRTSYNPEFIPTNFIRDFMFGNIAYAVEGGSMRKLNRNLGRAFRAINRSELGIESADIYDLRYREFMREGGQTGFMNMRNIEHMKKDLEKMHREMLETKNVSDVIFRNFFMKGGANIMKYLNAMSENAMRFAVFLTEREKGASAKQAAFAAKEITVNFNRKGRYTDNMGALYSFFNASIQGTARLYNLVKGHKKQAMIAIASLTAVKLVSALVASAVGGDDYDELSDYVKFSNIIIPIGVSEDGRTRFLKIPMAQGLRAITNIADVTVDVLRGTKTVAEAAKVFALNNLGEHIPLSFEAIDLTGRDSAASFAIPFLPTAVVPFFEAWRNVDFKGDPIFREDFTLQSEEYSPRYTRAYNSTNPIYTELSRWLNNLAGGNDELTSAVKFDENGMVSRRAYGYFFDINPAKVEHIINGFMGGVTTFPSNIIKTVSAAVSDEKDIEWYNVPILNRFVAQSSYKEGYDLFYRTGDLVRDIKASEKAVKAIGDMDAYRTIKSNMFNAEITRTYELYQDGVKQLREYLENPNLSNEMLKEYERKLDELMREASERFEQIYNKYDTNIERYEED